jgi:hypothetical protein
LESASFGDAVAVKGNLWGPIRKHINDFAVRDITHLVIVKNSLAAFVTGHVGGRRFVEVGYGPSERESNASVIGLTYVAIDTSPTFLTFTRGISISRTTVFTISQRVALRS